MKLKTTQTQNQTQSAKISNYLTLIVLIVMALSVAAILLAFDTYLFGDQLTAGILAAIGLIAMTMSVFLLYQSRAHTANMKKIEVPKVMTAIECQNKSCDSKTTREFQRGDYVYKELDVACAKCSGKQMITAIFKEVKEKEKTFNV